MAALAKKAHQSGLKLFLDLDGVLADFDAAILRLCGRHPDELPPQVMWGAVKAHPNFFGTLAMMKDAMLLWEHAKPYNPTILTGSPRGERYRLIDTLRAGATKRIVQEFHA